MSGTMKILKWIKKKVIAEVEFKVPTFTIIGRFDKALLREALDHVDGDQVLLASVRNYDGRTVSALCIYAPGGVGPTVALASVDDRTGDQRKLQE